MHDDQRRVSELLTAIATIRAERDALRAEVERLKAKLDKTHEAWLDWQVGLRMMGEVFNNRMAPTLKEVKHGDSGSARVLDEGAGRAL